MVAGGIFARHRDSEPWVGQGFGAPVAEWVLGLLTWQSTFMVFAAVVLSTILTLPLISAPRMAAKPGLMRAWVPSRPAPIAIRPLQ